MTASINLLSSQNRIEAPFIKVIIGNYEFGVYNKRTDNYGMIKETYPNYIKSLSINKINGEVNTYTLSLTYQITANDDPNYFEKVFSSVSDTRKIIFSYGDFGVPSYAYVNGEPMQEEAIITNVTSDLDPNNANISYKVTAVSSASISLAGSYTFVGGYKKPSDVIYDIIYNRNYGLTDIFVGMQNRGLVEQNGLIARDDTYVNLETKTNISILDYLYYLTSCMTPASGDSSVYTMTVIDDTTGVYGGSYIKITKVSKNTTTLNSISTYTVDIGYPSSNLVTDFRINNNQNYSILYDYNNDVSAYNYGKRIDDNGNISYVYAPPLTSSNQLHLTTESDKTWWKKVTEYPITATMTVKGLLRPAILMTYIKINMWFYGHKHISSGYYIITSQTDTIDSNGYRTTLGLTRIASDEDSAIGSGYFGEKILTDSNKYNSSNGRGSTIRGAIGSRSVGRGGGSFGSNNNFSYSGNTSLVSRGISGGIDNGSISLNKRKGNSGGNISVEPDPRKVTIED